MQLRLRLTAMAAVLLLIAGILSCNKDDNNPTPVVPPNSVRLATTQQFGAVMTDSTGRTLYFFSMDANGTSGCTGGCLAVWPVFYTPKLTLDSGLNAADFSTITRADGTKQTTYKGWPLYYYANDPKAGDIKGEAVGNKWFVAKPDYTVMLANIQLTGNDNVQYTSQYQPGQEITQYLTDDYGRTLYGFTPDKFNKNNYTKSDFSNNGTWPIYELKTPFKYAPSILDKTAFATTNVFGKTQLTYKGWPLYYFGADQQTRGNTKGVSVPKPGIWPIVNSSTLQAPPAP
ncbi:MAG TPA: hypothetical protein VM802_18555 [Chitinophaga sp.]|uniref:hypothetical protein n=1 Tax=Chitinophaga sp. TaxID=1869181 RepID=UPI002BA356D7|nr:hypothetical protein [Chitinophaga sp.]HVI46888.1 hypothetical protein [Chitinophaga sp.]